MKPFFARLFKYVSPFQMILIVLLLHFALTDKYSFLQRTKYNGEIKELQEQTLHLKEEIEDCRYKLHELQSNENNLEQFAREQYLMKRPNEDIFIIEE